MISLIKRRVVIDTNVFVSGVVFGGIPDNVLKLLKRSDVELLMSDLLAEEILTQLIQFHVSSLTYAMVVHEIRIRAHRLIPRITPHQSRDPKDDMLLALCMAGSADYLITGDKDLLVLRKFEKTHIITPKQFLKIMRS